MVIGHSSTLWCRCSALCAKPEARRQHKGERVICVNHACPGTKYEGLCNAVIMSTPNSEFLDIWYNSYSTFRAKPLSENLNKGGGGNYAYWDEHSVYLPKYLSSQHPDKLHVEDFDSFHFPIWDKAGMGMLFEEEHDLKKAYCHHLWESVSWKYLNNLTVKDIKTKNTTYNKIARRFL